MRTPIAFTVLSLLFVSGAALAEEPVDHASRVKEIFRTRCVECHGASRQEAGINLLDPSTFVGEDKYVTGGDVDSSYLFDTIASDDDALRMPKSPLPPLEPDQIEAVRKWIADGAKEFPEDLPTEDANDSKVIGTEYVLQKILSFIQSVPRSDRKYYRFFSSNHLLTAGATAHDLKVQQQALAKSINHLTWSRDLVVPEPIDNPVGSVFAVDIRKLGWSAKPYKIVRDGEASETSDFNLFDQVLLEYPYSVVLQSSEVFDELQEVYLDRAEMVRPIAFLRIDWFASVATQFPIYEDMLQLPHKLSELEKELGVHFETNSESGLVYRAGMTVSGVSRNNRVVERHPTKYGSYWKSYDFETSRGQQNMFIDPVDFHYAGGEMIWSLPNGLQGYLITDNLGNRINAAPTSIVTDKFAADKVVRNGLACMRCHDRGMKRFADNVRPAFEGLPDSSGRNREEVLALYIERELMDEYLSKDESQFLDAMEDALGEPQDTEPLISVSRRFLDAPLTLSQAAGEIGLRDTAVLNQIFKLPEFTKLGLAGLTAGGVVRRDTWEDYYDRVVNRLGRGIPIAPVDGLTRPDHLSSGLSFGLTISTNRSGNTFAPGDDLVITVANKTGHDQFIELVGTDSKGAKTVLTGVQLLKKGESLRLPETGSIKIQAQLGTEFVTVYARPQKFAAGHLLRGHRVADRFVHNFYELDGESINHVPSDLTRKTIKIETR